MTRAPALRLRTLVGGVAAAALAVGGLAATVVPAAAVGATLSTAQTQGLAYNGQQITVNGAGYGPGVTLYVAVCDTTKPPGSACDFAGAAQATTSAGGAFSAKLTVKGSFAGTDCLGGAATCAVVTSNKNNPGDMSSYATLPIGFAPVLTLSKSWLKAGDTVKLTGSHFPKKATPLFVTICGNPPGATNCDMTITHIGQIAYNGSGGFTAKYKVAATSFTTASGTINCAKVHCVIGTTNGADPKDQSYNSVATFKVGSAPGMAKITKLKVKAHKNVLVKWKAARTHGAPLTGYTVQVKKGHQHWKVAGKTGPHKTRLTWTKGKVNKTYTFRVVAKSPAGNTKGKAAKITI